MKKILLFLSYLTLLSAQTLEPRLYSNIPIDLNFLVVGAAHSEGSLPENSSLINPKLQINSAFLAYARGVNIAGKSAKIDVAIPTTCIDGTAIFLGTNVSRNICGLGDIKTRLSLNILGAPATSLKNFANYKQDTILGISLQITAPTGQYDKSKLVNISANRWALKIGTGISKKIKSFILELSLDAQYFTKNSQFIGKTRQQNIIYSTQAHLIYTLPKGIWFGFDANYYAGGENEENGVKLDDALNNSRYGATFSFPITKVNSIKINVNSGLFTRAGSDFDTISLFWQYRFIDGF